MMDYLEHSSKGWTKKDHKYVRKEGNRYIYEDDLKAKKNSNFLKGHKYVEKDPFTGKLQRSSNDEINRKSKVDHKRFIRQSNKRHEDFIKESERDHKKFMKDAADTHYNSLQEVDRQTRIAKENYKKSENPKYIKQQFDTSKKLLNRTLDELGKQYTDKTFKSKRMRLKIKLAKSRINSKAYDAATSALSNIGATFAKAYEKTYFKKLDKSTKQFKDTSNAQYKDWVKSANSSHKDWTKSANKSHKDWAKNANKMDEDWRKSSKR